MLVPISTARRLYKRDHSTVERRTNAKGDLVKVRVFSGPGFRTWARRAFKARNCAGKLAAIVGPV